MTNNTTEDKQPIPTNNHEGSPNPTFTILLSICLILSTVGLGLGIYNTITINEEKNLLTISEDFEDANYEDADNSEELSYGLPTDANSIENILISYNNYKDSVGIDPGYISYSEYDDAGENLLYDTTKQIDTTEIFQYFFDNCLQYLEKEEENEAEMSDDSSWAVEVYTTNNAYSYAIGTETPEWLEKLLEKLNIEK